MPHFYGRFSDMDMVMNDRSIDDRQGRKIEGNSYISRIFYFFLRTRRLQYSYSIGC
jgi:hypothetical protein